MSELSLIEKIHSLPPEQVAAVERFVELLQLRARTPAHRAPSATALSELARAEVALRRVSEPGRRGALHRLGPGRAGRALRRGVAVSHALRFASRVAYDASKPSITIAVHLTAGSERTSLSAKLDTGSSYSVFRREVGEEV